MLKKIALSQKSIDNRNKKNIPFDFYDISVCEDYINEIKKYGVNVRFISRWLNAISVEVDSELVLENIGLLDFVNKIEPLKKNQEENSKKMTLQINSSLALLKENHRSMAHPSIKLR